MGRCALRRLAERANCSELGFTILCKKISTLLCRNVFGDSPTIFVERCSRTFLSASANPVWVILSVRCMHPIRHFSVSPQCGDRLRVAGVHKASKAGCLEDLA